MRTETMDREKLRDGITDLVKGWLKGDTLELDSMLPIDEFRKVAEGCGLTMEPLTGEETMGWQTDFWYQFRGGDGAVYTLGGSLYYGNFKFSKDKEE